MTLQNSFSFSTDFTDSVGSLNLGMQANGISTNATASPTGIANHILIANNAFQSTIFSTDATTSGGIRSEVYFGQSAIGNENWYSWQWLINQADWVNGSTGICSFMQIHCVDTVTAANPIVLTVQSNDIIGYIPLSDPPTQSTSTTRIYLGRFTYGGWHTGCVHVLWENADTGWMDIIIDGVMRYRQFLRGNAYAADTPYLKLGSYDAFHTNTFGNSRRAYFRNTQIWQGTGSGYGQVLGTGIAPRPVFI